MASPAGSKPDLGCPEPPQRSANANERSSTPRLLLSTPAACRLHVPPAHLPRAPAPARAATEKLESQKVKLETVPELKKQATMAKATETEFKLQTEVDRVTRE